MGRCNDSATISCKTINNLHELFVLSGSRTDHREQQKEVEQEMQRVVTTSAAL
jgi:uncharacterized protein YheU (UPF0270 family)